MAIDLDPSARNPLESKPVESTPLRSHAEDLLPELNCFFLSANRHDKDRIEIQIGFDGMVPAERGKFEYTVDCYLFSPRTLGLLDIEDIEVLRQEFQSYIRLHTHVTNPASETSLNRVKDRLVQLKNKLSNDSIRYFAIEMEGALKGHAKRLKRNRKVITQFLHEIDTVEFLVRDFRSILEARELDRRKVDEFPRGSVDHDLLLLNEYISHLLVNYFSELYYMLQQSEDVDEVLRHVEENLAAEAHLRQAYGYFIDQGRKASTEQAEDQYLRRVSLLKKYFQSALFVKVKSTDRRKAAFVPIYGIAAALAALFTIFWGFYQARTMQERVGINSVGFISLGIAGYVIKDILKENFRKYFFKTSSYFFPDYRKELSLETGTKSQQLGYINEYLRMLDKKRVPGDLSHLRYSVEGGEMEYHLNEDIVHFKKRVVLKVSALGTKKGFPWGLREIIRFRYDRMLISMEDPYKTVNLISAQGKPLNRLAHRIYHTYIFTKISNAKASRGLYPLIKPAFKAFRVTLDKNGVLDCKEVKALTSAAI